jgi:hypothetical protein
MLCAVMPMGKMSVTVIGLPFVERLPEFVTVSV